MANKKAFAKSLLIAIGTMAWLLTGCEADMRAFKHGNNSPGRTQRPTGVSSQIAMASKPEQSHYQRLLDKWLHRHRTAQGDASGAGAQGAGGAAASSDAGAPDGAGGADQSQGDGSSYGQAGRHGGKHSLDRAFDESSSGTGTGASGGVTDDSDGLVAPGGGGGGGATGAARVGAAGEEGIKYTNDLSARGSFHLVARGESVESIAARYEVPPGAIAKWNPREARQGFPAGVMIYIPSAAEVAGARPGSGAGGAGTRARLAGRRVSGAAMAQRSGSASAAGARQAGETFAWPVEGPVVGEFVATGKHSHPGIDIGASEGTPIKAAKGGRVIYSGPMRGYGLVVILDHKDGTFSVYGHNKRNLVHTAGPTALVAQGQVIALVGHTGSATQPKLHFEVRRGNNPIDPRVVLPRSYAIMRLIHRFTG